VPVCREPGGHRPPAAQRELLREHFLKLCRDQTAKAIDDFDMLSPDDRVLVAVSGGKDSLAVWDILLELGYEADGLYIGLGIGEYSDTVEDGSRAFAEERGLTPSRSTCAAEYGYDVPTAAKVTRACRARRAGCPSATCSTRPRSTVATTPWPPATTSTTRRPCCSATCCAGRPSTSARQLPVLPARPGFPRKVKPLVRLGEREMAAYCIVRGIDYIVEECPMAVGNKHLGYKEALNEIEARRPGSKHDFYFGFLARASPASTDAAGRGRRG
jgi:tRNA(Ile)-lysidine synthase TilS/MesJ